MHSFLLQFQAFDFRMMTRSEPFSQLFHCLYVYPLTVSLSRKRNLFVRVELRKDDSDIRKPPLEVCSQSFHSSCWLMLSSKHSYPLEMWYARLFILGSGTQCYRSGATHRLLLEQEWLRTMMNLKSVCQLFWHPNIILCSHFSMLISRWNLKLRNQYASCSMWIMHSCLFCCCLTCCYSFRWSSDILYFHFRHIFSMHLLLIFM